MYNKWNCVLVLCMINCTSTMYESVLYTGGTMQNEWYFKLVLCKMDGTLYWYYS